MLLTGNVLGGQVAKLGARVWVVAGGALWSGRIATFLPTGDPVIARDGSAELSVDNAFVETTTETDVQAMVDGTYTWPLAGAA